MNEEYRFGARAIEESLHEGFDDVPRPSEFERPSIVDKKELNADYEGNWTNVFHHRLQDDVIEDRYIKLKTAFPTTEDRKKEYFIEANNRLSLEKPRDIPIDEYEEMISKEGYRKNIEKVFASTAIGESMDYNHKPRDLGVSGGRGHTGAVFKDAMSNNFQRLSPKQKEIIEAHEKAHGVFRGLTNGEKNYIKQVFATTRNIEKNKAIPGYSHKDQSDEIVARMSQLKNYFGFKGHETFTRAHLDLARRHYLADTDLDNNMREFFDSIDSENEDRFIDLMNTIAC